MTGRPLIALLLSLLEVEAVFCHLFSKKLELRRVRRLGIALIKPKLDHLDLECFRQEQVNRSVGAICAKIDAVGIKLHEVLGWCRGSIPARV
jgi:hypothetical protein